MATGLLWYYSTNYKRQFLIGNLVVSFVTALVPLAVAVYEIPMLNATYYDQMIARGGDFMVIFYWVLGFSVFAFVLTLIREIIKDIEDFEGDTAYGCETLPIMIGTQWSKVVVAGLSVAVIASFFVLYSQFFNDKFSLYYIVALTVLLLGLIFKVFVSSTKEGFHTASIFAKIIMVAGMCYSFVACYHFMKIF
jgi:4-hydroxybenzoate polyprenyltransferase